MTATVEPPADLASRLAALWQSSTPVAKPPTPEPEPTISTPAAIPPKLPPLPPPLRCELDHGNPANWQYGADRHGRKGWRRVTCRECGEFYGYLPPADSKSPK